MIPLSAGGALVPSIGDRPVLWPEFRHRGWRNFACPFWLVAGPPFSFISPVGSKQVALAAVSWLERRDLAEFRFAAVAVGGRGFYCRRRARPAGGSHFQRRQAPPLLDRVVRLWQRSLAGRSRHSQPPPPEGNFQTQGLRRVDADQSQIRGNASISWSLRSGLAHVDLAYCLRRARLSQ